MQAIKSSRICKIGYYRICLCLCYFNHFNPIHTHKQAPFWISTAHVNIFMRSIIVRPMRYCEQVSERTSKGTVRHDSRFSNSNAFCGSMCIVSKLSLLLKPMSHRQHIQFMFFFGYIWCERECHAMKIGQQHNKLNVLHKTNEAIHSDEALIKWQMFVISFFRELVCVWRGRG